MTRRGSVLVATMWGVVALTGVVLVLGYAMRVEAVAAANQVGRVQAGTAVRGAEQWLLGVAEAEVATPGSMQNVVLEGREIGAEKVWVVRPDGGNPEQFAYGLADEGGKVDLNTAGSAMLLKLPGITQEAVDSVLAWRGSGAGTGQGGTEEYYEDLKPGYRLKLSPLESVEELMLLKGIDKKMMFGIDRNRNGVIDGAERNFMGATQEFGGQNSDRGIYPFVTVHGVVATSAATTASTGGSATRAVDVNSDNTAALRSLLVETLGGDRAGQVVERTRLMRPFRNVFDWYFKVGVMTTEDLSKVYLRVTANAAGGGGRVAKLNVNTAAREALCCLPGLEDSDVDAILTRRQTALAGTDVTNISWLAEVLTREKAVAAGGLVTGKSTCFAGDIGAGSGDGRAFRRVRVVIDARQSPAKVIFRKDLTSAGWPLPAEVRTQLKSGEKSTVLQSTSRGKAAS